MGMLHPVLQFFLNVVKFTLDTFVNFLLRYIIYGKGKTISPPADQLLFEPAMELAEKIRSQQLSSRTVIEAYITRIKEVHKDINALIQNRFDAAIKKAEYVDKVLSSADDSEYAEEKRQMMDPNVMPLIGVPFTAKEAYAIQGMENTSGIVARLGMKNTKNAPVVDLLCNAGAIPLGLTNVSELCMWYESSNTIYGRTNNAYDTHRIVGGSSGGEGCLLSAAGSVIGVGSDIAGSIRMPAFFNGIFGHKPTNDIVPKTGQFPYATGESDEFLTCGPMCRYATDLLPLLQVMTQKCANPKLQLDKFRQVNPKKVKYYYQLSCGKAAFISEPQLDIQNSILKVADYLRSIGAEVREVKINKFKYSFEMWMAMMGIKQKETYSQLMASDQGEGVSRVHCGRELVKFMMGRSNHTLPSIILGLFEFLGDDQSMNDRLESMCQQLKLDLEQLLGDDGVLLFAPHPRVAPFHYQPYFHWFCYAYTGIFNMLHFPVTQVPLGLNSEGLPLGVQVVATSYNDHLPIAVAVELEKAFGGWHPPGAANSAK